MPVGVTEQFAEVRRRAAQREHEPPGKRALHTVVRQRRSAEVTRRGTVCRELNKGLLARAAIGAYTMVIVLASPEVPAAVFEDRMAHCRACPHATVKGDNKHFCQCCGCPEWSALGEGSDVEHKNKHAAHECQREPPAFGAWEGDSGGV